MRAQTRGCVRQIDFLSGEIDELDRRIAKQALAMPGFHHLLTIPGVDVGTAAAVIAAVGEISRFQSPGQLVAYLGLDPKGRQSGHTGGRSRTGTQRQREVVRVRHRGAHLNSP